MDSASFPCASVLQSLPRETLLVVIEQLCSKLTAVKARLADSEERNRLLQHKLPQLLTTAIRSMLEFKPDKMSQNGGESSPIHDANFQDLNSPIDTSPTLPLISEQRCLPTSDPPFTNGIATASTSDTASHSQVLNFLTSFMQMRSNDFQGDATSRRRRKLMPQKNHSPKPLPSPEVADDDVSGASTVSVNAGDEKTQTPSQRTDGSFLDPIPLEWSSNTLPPLPPLKAADAASRSSDMETEDILSSVTCEDLGDDASLSDEALHEMDEQIRKSMSIRKNHYWQVYQESEGWTKATCALMSCLFTRSQMAQSTVLGRGGQPSGHGTEVRYRLPVKSVHYIVATIKKRFDVAPSKVRARMAQKCKDARRAARKAAESSLGTSVLGDKSHTMSTVPSAFRTRSALPSTSI